MALEAEARPLVERYGLRRDPTVDAFKVFHADETFRGEGVALVVSGLGKVASAAATAYLHLLTGGEINASWINVGIAGHRSRPLGEAVLGHKILDRASGRSWYPPHVFAPRLTTDEIVTVDGVERAFDDDGAHEMEASGFYPTACRFATAELVQCLKVVSDGPGDVPERLSARRVTELIAGQMEAIEWLVGETDQLGLEMRRLEEDPPELESLLGRWHFTVTEARQLRRLLERWHTLMPGRPLPEAQWAELRRGKEVLRHMRSVLAQRTL